MPVTTKVHITETAGLERAAEWIRFSAPYGRGELLADQDVSLIGPDGISLPCQRKVLKQWPDGSVKWLLVDAAVHAAAGTSTTYLLGSVPGPSSPAGVRIERRAKDVVVDTGAAVFTVDTERLRPFLSVMHGGVEVSGAGTCLVVDEGGQELDASVDRVEVEDDGRLHAILRLSGKFRAPGFAPYFSMRLHFFADGAATRVDFTVHNPRAARHKGGLWDLGDEGSYFFKSLGFEIPLAGTGEIESLCFTEPAAAPICSRSGSLAIYQESSGGENWLSPNHRTRSGKVPLRLHGFVVEEQGRQLHQGLRATPELWVGEKGSGISAAVPHFWQEFPKALAVKGRRLQVELFPAAFPEPHELQGGEQKSHTFDIDFGSGPRALLSVLSPLKVVVSPESYRRSNVFADLPPAEGDVVDLFTTPSELQAKREKIDEYGWRNFGELVADHEAAFHEGDSPFISHYNNQYDGCAGTYRKFFATGDQAWGELAADLARHLLDIDIYHTSEDREEYNGGFFWHTDHYIQAGLATHRSFSTEHLVKKDPRFCGGGPGAEHCYTTGLMIHYFQTGDPSFKEAVLGVADWCLRSLRGPQTILAALKRGADNLKKSKGVRGTQALFPRFPLTRGTGNAIVACLDAYEIGGGRSYLEQVQELIEGAIHPDDNIRMRNLLNPEIAWSYTVFLTSVGKFLDKKMEIGECDSAFDYALQSLLAYADWMMVHEYPYLEKTELLEYPNETWAAQDLRKSVVFLYAARYAGEGRRKRFLERGREFFEKAREELLRRKTSSLTRPVILMLQNGWVGSRLGDPIEGEALRFNDGKRSWGRRPPNLTFDAVVGRTLSDIVSASRRTSVQREWSWLRARIG